MKLEILDIEKHSISVLIDDKIVIDFDIDGKFEIVDDSFAHEFGVEKSFYFEDNTTLSVTDVYDYETEEPVSFKVSKELVDDVHNIMYEEMCEIYLKDLQ